MPQHSVTLESPYGRIKLVPPSPSEDLAYAQCRVHPTTRKYLRFLPEQMSEDDARVRRETRAEDPRIVDLIIHYIDNTPQDAETQDDQNHGSSESKPESKPKETFAGFSGYFNVDSANSSCEAGIIVSPDMHGKGLATEVFYVLLQYVFEEKGFHSVVFTTGADNVPMQRWLEEVAGARLEMERREAWRNLDGSWTDVKGYGILEGEWREGVKGRLEKRLAKYLP